MAYFHIFFKTSGDEAGDQKTRKLIKQNLRGVHFAEVIDTTQETYLDDLNALMDREKSGYFTLINSGDTFTRKYFNKLADASDNNTRACLFGRKRFQWQNTFKDSPQQSNRKLNNVLLQYTDVLAGTVINLESVGELRFNKALQFEAEADFLMRFAVQNTPTFVNGVSYNYIEPDVSQYQINTDVYYREWYFDSITEFMIPLLESSRDENGNIPIFLQYYIMFCLQARFDANQNNRNKHVLGETDIPAYKELIVRLLSYIDDAVIMNIYDDPVYSKNYQYDRMFLRLKYEKDYLDLAYLPERATLSIVYNDNIIFLLNKMRFNVIFMEMRGENLYIDGSVPDIFSKSEVEYYFTVNDVRYEVEFNEGYSLVKYFGQSAYKRFPFSALLPLETGKTQTINFYVKYKNFVYRVLPEFSSHTSRLTPYPKSGYWRANKNWIFKQSKDTIVAYPYTVKRHVRAEFNVWKEILRKHNKNDVRTLKLRGLYLLTKPFFQKKPIWLFYDKIYKGGDSSEYLYRYAEQQKDGIKKYYLLDEKATDYKRMQKDGYKPLKRGSLLHRLVFLNAQMIIVSNSTVFAFNDYTLMQSRFIRGIVDFHVVCVQHGLSVQKIGLAQQRLRDNTRLYFCASKYEIENLNHPIYNYHGDTELKLTGVPRYDGLINDDKKQIMISPTWRMQSAMLVSKNEGVARDYNPNFKDTDYFKIYNSLINDERLLAAAKEYGYRIAYVLHPIVSPQAGDFDANEYVDIVPSIGDMSYEKMFRESSLMVTDFSGIQFDFAYMRKPLIYHHHRDLDAHYEEGTYHYDTMAFGEITHDNEELIDLIIDYMKNGCQMKDEYRRRADDFFAYNDHNNCQRIYDIMIEYQKNIGK